MYLSKGGQRFSLVKRHGTLQLRMGTRFMMQDVSKDGHTTWYREAKKTKFRHI